MYLLSSTYFSEVRTRVNGFAHSQSRIHFDSKINFESDPPRIRIKFNHEIPKDSHPYLAPWNTFWDTSGITTVRTYPIAAMEIVVNDSEAFPGVVAPVSPAHQVLDNQADINQSDLIVWRQVTLQESTEATWWMTLNRLRF